MWFTSYDGVRRRFVVQKDRDDSCDIGYKSQRKVVETGMTARRGEAGCCDRGCVKRTKKSDTRDPLRAKVWRCGVYASRHKPHSALTDGHGG